MKPYYRSVADLEAEMAYQVQTVYGLDPNRDAIRKGLLSEKSLQHWWSLGLSAETLLLQTLGAPQERVA